LGARSVGGLRDTRHPEPVSRQEREASARDVRTLRPPSRESQLAVSQPDLSGPKDAGYIAYSTGSADPNNPLHLPFIPPLLNERVRISACDLHGRRGFVPASVAHREESS
jgi:hypothetical protein